jgi:hypothetical protein
MTEDMRLKFARESYEEKIRKVGLLVQLVKSAPKLAVREVNATPDSQELLEIPPGPGVRA